MILAANVKQNLVARGEHTKPSAGGNGGANPTTSPYDNNNQHVLGNPMDGSADGVTDFAYGPPGDSGAFQ